MARIMEVVKAEILVKSVDLVVLTYWTEFSAEPAKTTACIACMPNFNEINKYDDVGNL